MVGIGLLMALYGLVGGILMLRRRLTASRAYLRWATLMGPAGFIAILAGWFTTEIGRQPWIVYGLMRTSEAASPIAAQGVLGSLLGFVAVYTVVFGAGVFYILRLMRQPTELPPQSPADDGPIRTAGSPPSPSADGELSGQGA